MITFKDILLASGVDASRVKLPRYTVKGMQILEFWRMDRALVEELQLRQNVGFFDGVDHAGLLPRQPSGDAVFGGLNRVDGWTSAAPDDRDTFTGEPNDGTRATFGLTPEPEFAPYEDRLFVP